MKNKLVKVNKLVRADQVGGTEEAADTWSDLNSSVKLVVPLRERSDW